MPLPQGYQLNNEIAKLNPVHVICGRIAGIAIVDNPNMASSLLLVQLTEDDGTWHRSSGSYSSFWLYDLITVYQETEKWLNENAIKGDWGWYLKSDEE